MSSGEENLLFEVIFLSIFFLISYHMTFLFLSFTNVATRNYVQLAFYKRLIRLKLFYIYFYLIIYLFVVVFFFSGSFLSLSFLILIWFCQTHSLRFFPVLFSLIFSVFSFLSHFKISFYFSPSS